MAIFRLSNATRNAIAERFASIIGSGGVIELYDGAQPASPEAKVTKQRLLASLEFGNPPFGHASFGLIESASIAQRNAKLSGTATWARVRNVQGDVICDCDVGHENATVNMNTTEIVERGPVVISSFAIQIPGD